MNIDNSTISRAISTWGYEKQMKMVREECLELALAIGKVLERSGNADVYTAMQKEIADVNIMIQQANLMCGYEAIQGFVDQKMARLNDRLDKKEF